MKIVCEQCGKKYSIDDEKVKGKMFKIRCRNCGNVIIVRASTEPKAEDGLQPFPEDGGLPTRVVDMSGYGDELPIWYIVLEGNQAGPYTLSQLTEMLSKGEINYDTYCWRDGFEDWKLIRETEEIINHLQGVSQTKQPGDVSLGLSSINPPNNIEEGYNPEYSIKSPTQSASDSLIGDSIGEIQKTKHPHMAINESPKSDFGFTSSDSISARREEKPREVDLFGSNYGTQESFFSSDPSSVLTSAPSPRVELSAMPGVRHENSVLFSLSNLQALATTRKKHETSRTPSSSGTTEGSGLIDIRALSSDLVKDSSSGSETLDEILAIGGIGPGIGVPVLMPQRQETNKLLYVGITLGALIIIGLIVVVVVLLTRKPTIVQQPQVTQLVPPPVLQQGTIPPAQGTSLAMYNQLQNQPTSMPSNPQINTPERNSQILKEEEEKAAEETTKKVAIKAIKKQKGAENKEEQSAEEVLGGKTIKTSTTATTGKTSGTDTIDDLINQAIGGGSTRKVKKETSTAEDRKANIGGEGLPDLPSKEDIKAGMEALKPQVLQCGQGQKGVISVKVVIEGATGRVSTATVEGDFTGTPVGSCVARVVRTGKFPKFKRPNLTVIYRFTLK